MFKEHADAIFFVEVQCGSLYQTPKAVINEDSGRV